jgi:hypothetical protein
MTGTIVWVTRPGTTGIGVDVGLPVGGFVDVLLLRRDPTRWPAEQTRHDFYVWWMDERPQIRLVAADLRHRRDDFDTWVRHQSGPTAQAFLRQQP